MIHWFVLRPTFEIPVSVSREVAMDRMSTACKNYAQPRIFFVHGEYGELHLPVDQHRLWSPHLSFYVSHEGNQPIIRGRFAPRLEIWTFVWVLYLAMAFTAFFSLVMAFSKSSIGEETWWHWGAGLAMISILLIYIVANIGQQWSSDQMQQLKEQLEHILAESQITHESPTQLQSEHASAATEHAHS